MLERTRRDRRSEPRRRAVIVRTLLVALLLVLAFIFGMAFARTLDERADDPGVLTSERTLTPLPQEPPARTVTVTVTTSP